MSYCAGTVQRCGNGRGQDSILSLTWSLSGFALIMEEILRQDPDILETLQSLIDQGKTYQEISDILRATHSSVHGGLKFQLVVCVVFAPQEESQKELMLNWMQ